MSRVCLSPVLAVVFTSFLFSDRFIRADSITQTFTGSAPAELNGSSVGGTAAKWSTSTSDNPPKPQSGVFNADGNTVFANNATASFPTINLSSAPPGIYTVTLNFTIKAASDNWLGLGFGDAQGDYLMTGSNVGPSMLARDSASGIAAFPGPGVGLPAFANAGAMSLGMHSISLSIDTTASNWKTVAALDGKTLGTYAYTGHGGLDQIGSIEIFGYRESGAAYALNSITTNAAATEGSTLAHVVPSLPAFPTLYMTPEDQGIVLRHGDGPDNCDEFGARDVYVWKDGDTFYMNYDGAGPKGWLVCAATSDDGVHWKKHGPVIDLGVLHSGDSATASYGVTYFDGSKWWMYYLGSENASPAPDRIPIIPYETFTAEASSPLGPWKKRYDLAPITQGSPGPVLKMGNQYMMIFTMGIARTDTLEKPWKVDPAPLFVPNQSCENISLYYEPTNQTWFLFTNHIGSQAGWFYTDAIWVFWTKDINHWNTRNRAIAFDGKGCNWSKTIIGLPSVLKIGDRLAVYYDGTSDPTNHTHMRRDVGLAWLKLPLQVPTAEAGVPQH